MRPNVEVIVDNRFARRGNMDAGLTTSGVDRTVQDNAAPMVNPDESFETLRMNFKMNGILLTMVSRHRYEMQELHKLRASSPAATHVHFN